MTRSARKQIVPSLALLLLFVVCASALSILGGSSSMPATLTPTMRTSVEVISDRIQPIAGAVVQLDTSNASVIAVTNSDGQLPWQALDVSSGVRLVLAERTYSAGTAIGMIELVPSFFTVDPTANVITTTISRTQPLAVPMLVEGLKHEVNNILPPGGAWPHWQIAVPEDSKLRFTANIGSLLDNEAIDHFLAYRGHSIEPDLGYVRGLVLVLPAVDLGAEGIVVGLRLLGDLTAGPIIDTYLYTTTGPFGPSSPGFASNLIDLQNDVAYVQITGNLRSGHLALLARSSSGPSPILNVIEDDPPQIIVPPTGGQGNDSAKLLDQVRDQRDVPAVADEQFHLFAMEPATPFVTDCDPPVPGNPPGWSCTPLPPSSNHCGAPTPAGAADCKTVRSRGPIMCRVGGATVRSTTARTTKWKVSLNLGGGSGTPLTSGGGFEYGQEEQTVVADEWTAGAGAHGQGQCMRYFRFELVCGQAFTIMVDRVIYLEAWAVSTTPCVLPTTANSVCIDNIVSQSVCDRTP